MVVVAVVAGRLLVGCGRVVGWLFVVGRWSLVVGLIVGVVVVIEWLIFLKE